MSLVSISHGWFFQCHPDPFGEKQAVLRQTGAWPHMAGPPTNGLGQLGAAVGSRVSGILRLHHVVVSAWIVDLEQLFPFQVIWDSSVTLEPLSEEAAAVFPEAYAGLRVRYPEGVGYTPGDVYDLFYDENFVVTHWVFRKGGSVTPTRAAQWIDYADIGPFSISLNRTTADNSLRIWFEGVSVELVD